MYVRKIMIVNDDKQGRKGMEEYFSGCHYEVEGTSSAAYAIARIVQGNNPIVILGDSFEETISPLDVTALMKRCNKHLNIILVSDNSSLESLRHIREEGIYYHSLKPMNTEDMEEIKLVIDYATKGELI